MPNEWKVMLRPMKTDNTNAHEWHRIYAGPEGEAHAWFESTLKTRPAGELQLLDPKGAVRLYAPCMLSLRGIFDSKNT